MTTTALAVVRNDSALAQAEQWSGEQKALIKKTCFPDSTDDELKLYLHVAAKSGLDPLRKQIHAMRLKGRLTFVADINGLQARAAREADYEGIDCAAVFEGDDFVWDAMLGAPVKHHSNPFKAKPIGAWAIVHRKGMRPFVSLVRFDEYNNFGNGLWKEKPSVMILKVAKSTALRLAYPEQLGSLYERAELDKAQREGFSQEEPSPPPKPEHHFSAEAVRLADAVQASQPAPAPTAAQAVIDAVVEPPEPTVASPPPPPAAPDRPTPTKGELRRRAWACWQMKQKEGMTSAQFNKWAEGIIGHARPQPEWTEADVEKLEAEVMRGAGPAR